MRSLRIVLFVGCIKIIFVLFFSNNILFLVELQSLKKMIKKRSLNLKLYCKIRDSEKELETSKETENLRFTRKKQQEKELVKFQRKFSQIFNQTRNIYKINKMSYTISFLKTSEEAFQTSQLQKKYHISKVGTVPQGFVGVAYEPEKNMKFNQTGFVLLAKKNNQIIGECIFSPLQQSKKYLDFFSISLPNQAQGMILQILVDQRFRNRNITLKLFKETFLQAKKRGFTTIHAISNAKNRAIFRFFAKLNFQIQEYYDVEPYGVCYLTSLDVQKGLKLIHQSLEKPKAKL